MTSSSLVAGSFPIHRLVLLLLLTFTIPSFLAAQDCTLNGKVVKFTNGAPLDFASVRLGTVAGMNTDEKGRYELTAKPGTYTLVVTYIGYETVEKEVTLNRGENLTLNIRLQETGSKLGPVVISSSQFEKNLAEENISMDVIDDELFKNNNATELGEAVDKSVGVQVQDGQISIRGGSSWSYGVGTRTAVLVDNLSFTSADLQSAQLKHAPIEQAEQVEVIKGASSVVYGSSALNGVVNVRTGWPGETPKTEITVFQGIYGTPAEPAIQSWEKWQTPNFGGISFASKRQLKENYDLIVGGNLNRRQSYLEGDDEFRVRANFKTRYRHPRISGLSYGINGNTMYERSAAFFLPINVQDSSLFAADFSTDRYIRTNIDPHFNYVNEKGMRHKVQIRWMNVFRYGNDEDPNAISHFINSDYQAQKRWGNDTNSVVLTAGIPMSYGTASSNLYAGKRVTTSGALYAQGEVKRDRFGATGGVRYEFNTVDTVYTATIPVFRTGLNYRAGKATWLRTSWGQAYRLPSVGERFVDAQSDVLRIFPNADLSPERGWSYEFGVKQGIEIDKWQGLLDVSVFYNEFDDFVEYRLGVYIPDGTAPINLDTIGKYTGMKPFNVEEARVAGFEIELFGKGTIGDFEIRTLGGYTYNYPANLSTDTTQRNLGVFFGNAVNGIFNRLEQPIDTTDFLAGGQDSSSILNFRTRHLFKTDVEVFYKQWSVGYTAFYGSFPEFIQPLYFGIVGGLDKYADAHRQGDWVHGVRGSYTIKDKSGENDFLKVSVIVKNLLNRFYAARPGKLDAPRNVAVQLRFFL